MKNKSTPVLNGVTLGYGANVWSPVLHHYLIQVFFAVDTIILGCLTAILCFLIRKKVESRPILFLGLLIMVVGIWVLSESNLRQLVFHRPSLSTYFSFLSLESMAALACMYFDRVQKKRYHLTYLIVESCILGQLLVNLSLHFCRTANLYESLVFSHFWSGIAIIAALTCLFRDMKSHKIEEYRMVAIGFLLFMAMCLIELVQFYLNRFHRMPLRRSRIPLMQETSILVVIRPAWGNTLEFWQKRLRMNMVLRRKMWTEFVISVWCMILAKLAYRMRF